MKWGYKTIHFALKKEGLLGAGFLDETEIEQALNEYGRSGWELVSVLDVQDGIIAIFKQPLGVIPRPDRSAPAPVEAVVEELPEPQEDDYSGFDNEPEADPQEVEEPPANTIGAIKIE
jgi:hypothetical protein